MKERTDRKKKTKDRQINRQTMINYEKNKRKNEQTDRQTDKQTMINNGNFEKERKKE
jgi:hypothetical protein